MRYHANFKPFPKLSKARRRQKQEADTVTGIDNADAAKLNDRMLSLERCVLGQYGRIKKLQARVAALQTAVDGLYVDVWDDDDGIWEELKDDDHWVQERIGMTRLAEVGEQAENKNRRVKGKQKAK